MAMLANILGKDLQIKSARRDRIFAVKQFATSSKDLLEINSENRNLIDLYFSLRGFYFYIYF